MLTIGQFARLAQVSVKLLRHYDRLGLLKPVQVNPETSYRYYAVDQLDRLNRILALQNLGMSLKEIERLLDERVSADELRGMLRLKQARLRQTLEREGQRLREVETRLAQIESADPDFQAYHLALKSTSAVQVAGIRRVLTDGERIAPLFGEVYAALKAASLPPGAKIGGAVGLYDLSEPLDRRGLGAETFLLANGRRARDSEHPGACFFDLEAVYEIGGGIPRGAALSDGEPLTVRELPSLPTVAAVVHRGALNARYNAYRLFTHWADANAYVVSGAIREVYLSFHGQPNHPDNLLEIQIPVEKKG